MNPTSMELTVNKADLVKALEKTLGSRKAANEALDAVLDTVIRAVTKGEKVSITGFGTLERIERAARMGRNPATGEAIQIKASKKVAFRAAKALKEAV